MWIRSLLTAALMVSISAGIASAQSKTVELLAGWLTEKNFRQFERSGDIVFDGFFLVKSGGIHQGTYSYGLEPVDEAKVRLDPRIKVVTQRLK